MDQPHRFTDTEIVAVLALSKDATAIYTTEDLIIQTANDAMIGFWGKDRSVIGKSFIQAVPELNGQPFFKLLKKVWRTGITYEAKDTAAQLRINGELQWSYYDFIYRAIKNDQGEIYCILHTATDVTERHQAHMALEEGMDREQNLTEELTVTNEELAAANEELATANEEILSTNEELARSRQQLFQLNTELEERILLRTNDLFTAQAEAERQRDRVTRFFMQAPAGICILDGPDLVFELVNPLYQQLLPGRVLLGRPLLEAVPEIREQEIWDVLKGVYTAGRTFEGHELLVPLAKTDGGTVEDRYFNFIYQAREDENGNVDGILVFVIEVTESVLAKKAIAEREQQLRSLVMTAHYGLMILKGREWQIEIVNQQIANLWQKTLQEITGQKLMDVLPEIKDQPFPDLLAKVYDSGIGYGQEEEVFYLDSPEGPVRKYVSFYYDPMLDDAGRTTGIIVACEDVTEKVRARQLLEESYSEQQLINEELSAVNEELAAVNEKLLTAQQKIEEGEVALRLAIDAANFGTWFIHSVTREFITDARLKELFGYYPDEELSIEAALAQITEDYRAYVSFTLENAICNNGDYDVTYPVIGYHDKKFRWLRAIGNLKADPSGTFSAFTGVVMDITEQTVAAKKVQRAEESLRMAVDAAGLGTYYINAADRIFVASPRLKQFFGFRPDDEVPYEAAINQIHQDYRQQAADLVEAAFTKGTRFDMEYPIIGYHDGRIRWVRGLGEMQHSDGKDYFAGVLHEITEKKQDEIRKNDFIGMVSHELKTPLTSLTAIIQVASGKLKNSEDVFLTRAMDKAHAQVKKMSNIINGFLNVSRLESGKILINKQDFDLDQLLTETIEEAKFTLSTHSISFTPCGPLFVHADRDKIGSVISNLLNNAVKYSPKGKLIEVKCQVKDSDVIVSIKDEGMGIKPQDLDKIFDRYYRVESGHTINIAGFGIGLYLSAEIIQRHDSRIWAESKSGAGSTFYFSLPLSKW